MCSVPGGDPTGGLESRCPAPTELLTRQRPLCAAVGQKGNRNDVSLSSVFDARSSLRPEYKQQVLEKLEQLYPEKKVSCALLLLLTSCYAFRALPKPLPKTAEIEHFSTRSGTRGFKYISHHSLCPLEHPEDLSPFEELGGSSFLSSAGPAACMFWRGDPFLCPLPGAPTPYVPYKPAGNHPKTQVRLASIQSLSDLENAFQCDTEHV